MLTFQLTSDNQASCNGHTVTHRTPILALCRTIKDLGYPDDTVVAKRGIVDCVHGTLYGMAGLTIKEEPFMRLAKFEPFNREVFTQA